MPRKTTPKKFGDVDAARDVIMGDQINNADLSRVETLLAEAVALLRQPQSTITVGQNTGVLIVGDHNEVRLTPADLSALHALGRAADPARREELYLTRFILGETYARWDRYYLPLAGQLLEAPIRLNDRADPGIGAGGLALKDVREAIQGYGKTRLVILGEPGAGKTTTLQRFARDLALERLREPITGKLPVFVNLANFGPGYTLPADFLRVQWETTGLGLAYGETVAAGQVCFLLDGVNQMPADDRPQRIEAWRRWALSDNDLPPGNLALFTCRVADYIPALNLPEVRVQTLDNDRIRRYFEIRFGGERAPILWREFETRLRSGDQRFEQLARNPFMLSLLAERIGEGKSLADSKGALLDYVADRRLKYELDEAASQPPALTADPRGTGLAALDALGRMAFAMQAKRGEGTVFARAELERVPLGDAGHLRLSLDEVLGLAVKSTLLDEQGQGEAARYEFRHQLLQEYFAARELLRRFHKGEQLGQHWNVEWQKLDPRFWRGRLARGERLAPPPTTGWEETVTMAAGLAAPGGGDAPRFVAAIRNGNLPLAGRALAEAGPDRPDLKDLAGSLRAELLARQRSSTAHLRARVAAGLALGELGHPDLRPREFEFEGKGARAILPPLQAVPAGEFIRGSDPSDTRAYRNENTTERRHALLAFSIGRYPVTNAEYKFFVEDGGYQTDRWWSEEGLKWKAGGPEAHATAMEQWMQSREFLKSQKDLVALMQSWGRTPANIRFWKEVTQLTEDEARERARKQFERPFDRPAFWEDTTLNSPARPVVGINWHEAGAYCRWLSAITRQPFALPSEMQWEKAARGVAGQEYPWGEKFDSSLCNTNESHIYTTAPIGLFPTGVSPFGLHDASGNVWEWTADWYQMYPGGDEKASADFGEKFKVVRGGSWYVNSRSARCAYRLRGAPDDFGTGVGFRILSPVSISGF